MFCCKSLPAVASLAIGPGVLMPALAALAFAKAAAACLFLPLLATLMLLGSAEVVAHAIAIGIHKTGGLGVGAGHIAAYITDTVVVSIHKVYLRGGLRGLGGALVPSAAHPAARGSSGHFRGCGGFGGQAQYG